MISHERAYPGAQPGPEWFHSDEFSRHCWQCMQQDILRNDGIEGEYDENLRGPAYLEKEGGPRG